MDAKTAPDIARSPRAITHNISINITEADSPMCVRRRIHFRSLSDVTPASRAHTPRARSHSERPGDGASPPGSPCLSPPASPRLSPPEPARRAHSERSSPNVSLVSVSAEHARSDTEETPPTPRQRQRQRAARFRSDTVTIVGNPWRKMSEADLKNGGKRTNPLRSSFDKAHANDPWIRDQATYPKTLETKKAGNFNVFRGVSQNAEPARPAGDSESKREVVSKRGKLERKSPVVCDSCGNESCECWRPRSPRCPRTPRLTDMRTRRALSSPGAPFDVGRKLPAKAEGGVAEAGAGLKCTCEGVPRSPRPSPARLAPRPPPPAPAHAPSAEDRPRSVSQQLHEPQRIVCSNDVHGDVKKPADPLLETTC